MYIYIYIYIYISLSLSTYLCTYISILLLKSPKVDLLFGSAQGSGSGPALFFWLFKGGFKVSLGTVEWHIRSSDTEFDNSEIAGPISAVIL